MLPSTRRPSDRLLTLPSRHLAATARRGQDRAPTRARGSAPFFALTCALAVALIAVVAAPSAALAQGGASVGSDAALPEVAPVEPFLASDLAPVRVNPRSAVLEIETTIDLACVVVYGPDATFGQLALDEAMGAAAHRDHRVVLTGLEPDRDYAFRLQGSAPDGRLFASRVVPFRTPPETTDARFGPRLPDLRVVDASSEFSAAFAAANAVDGDGGSEWSSRGDGNDAWIELALPGRTPLSGVGVWTRTMSTRARIVTFTVRTDDGSTFGPFELPDADGLHRFPVDATTGTLRLDVVDSTGGNTGLVEVEAYGAP